MALTLEICVDDAPGLEAAVKGGADCIELCSALELGGLTPSAAMLARAVATGVPVHPMIRPRTGDFVYDDSELAAMVEDIRLAVAAGAAGVVVGAALPDGRLDRESLARFRDAAGTATLVLHRVIDLAPDPLEAVEDACALGFDKVLSSGGAPTAAEGEPVLRRMVEAAAGRLSVMAGSGINPANVGQIISGTGVNEVHASASVPGPTPADKVVRLGFASGPRGLTDAATVRKLRDALTLLEDQKA